MKHFRLQIVLLVIMNNALPIQLTSVTDATTFQYPVFAECKGGRYCKKRMGTSGSFTCFIHNVHPDVRLSVITNSSELNLYFQRESVVTTDGISDVSIQSNFSIETGCNDEFMVTCKAMDGGASSKQVASTAQLGILIDCSGEKVLSIEEKVWLAAITLFPFLWVFTLVIVCYMNHKNIYNTCRHDRTYTRHSSENVRQTWLRSARRMSLTIRPRPVKDIDGEPNDESIAYVYFIDERCCYTVSAKAPHKSVKLVLEKKPSTVNEGDTELSILEGVNDSSTPENIDQQRNSDVTDDASEDSIEEAERKASICSDEILVENSLDWCRCGKCQEGKGKYKVCCRRTYGDCVTDDPLFYQLVTDRNTLQAAMIQWNDKQVASRFEAMAYKEYIFWQMGITRNYSKVIIPSCVVKKVQARYPNYDLI